MQAVRASVRRSHAPVRTYAYAHLPPAYGAPWSPPSALPVAFLAPPRRSCCLPPASPSAHLISIPVAHRLSHAVRSPILSAVRCLRRVVARHRHALAPASRAPALAHPLSINIRQSAIRSGSAACVHVHCVCRALRPPHALSFLGSVSAALHQTQSAATPPPPVQHALNSSSIASKSLNPAVSARAVHPLLGGHDSLVYACPKRVVVAPRPDPNLHPIVPTPGMCDMYPAGVCVAHRNPALGVPPRLVVVLISCGLAILSIGRRLERGCGDHIEG
ncbi:hypothetical protein HYPSUDRAFT_1045869 [Hypholoma sublateritium FD-334 SS-4]|uniref:Uncharacterized protein n=1 Tax=Hypholoma sublateritium (strain FD-334 SS-4) TaxID=945553 RepID=A0A0D2P9G2_HYPSF|nr:hypothetical protein HYPSUDRAFT_1045869 [Hypholoma sublateritium FD-334 SS-4]